MIASTHALRCVGWFDWPLPRESREEGENDNDNDNDNDYIATTRCFCARIVNVRGQSLTKLQISGGRGELFFGLQSSVSPSGSHWGDM